MLRRARITKAGLEKNPAAEWNGFIELLACTAWEELGTSQRPAALVFWYESEVQNGGHLQYFMNGHVDRGDETVQAPTQLGADAQAIVLGRALQRWRAVARLLAADALEYAAIAGEPEFDDLDREFHACQVTLIDALYRHLASHKERFVVRE